MSRRRFLSVMGGAVFSAACGPSAPVVPSTGPRARAAPVGDVAAVLFDLFTLFDPRGVDARVNAVLGPNAPFTATWKSRLFEYSWIRATAAQYVDFLRLVDDSLSYASRAHQVALSSDARAKLAAAFTELTPWPDSIDVLQRLKRRGLRLGPLANFSPAMIEALLSQARMRPLFDLAISTDQARTYKPDPRAYALGEALLGLPRQRVAFAAFGGWDAAGAGWFGYPTFWVNRLAVAPEELAAADATGPDLVALERWIEQRSAGAAT